MADLLGTDEFLVNRSDVTYTQQQETLMASLQDTDHLLINRAGQTYKITGSDLIESVIDPLEVTVILNPDDSYTKEEVTAIPVVSGGKQPDGGYTFTYQWVTADDATGTNKTNIPGETGATYTPTNAEVGKYVGCVVSTTDALGTSAEGEAYIGPIRILAEAPVIDDVVVSEIYDEINRFTDKEFPYITTMLVDGEPAPTYELKTKLSGTTFDFDVISDAITKVEGGGTQSCETSLIESVDTTTDSPNIILTFPDSQGFTCFKVGDVAQLGYSGTPNWHPDAPSACRFADGAKWFDGDPRTSAAVLRDNAHTGDESAGVGAFVGEIPFNSTFAIANDNDGIGVDPARNNTVTIVHGPNFIRTDVTDQLPATSNSQICPGSIPYTILQGITSPVHAIEVYSASTGANGLTQIVVDGAALTSMPAGGAFYGVVNYVLITDIDADNNQITVNGGNWSGTDGSFSGTDPRDNKFSTTSEYDTTLTLASDTNFEYLTGEVLMTDGTEVSGTYIQSPYKLTTSQITDVNDTDPNSVALTFADPCPDLQYFQVGDPVQVQSYDLNKLIFNLGGFGDNFYLESVYVDGSLLWDSNAFPDAPVNVTTGEPITDYIEISGATSNGTDPTYNPYWANGKVGGGPNGKVTDTQWRAYNTGNKAVIEWTGQISFRTITLWVSQGSAAPVAGDVELEDGTVVATIVIPGETADFVQTDGVPSTFHKVISTDTNNNKMTVDGGDWFGSNGNGDPDGATDIKYQTEGGEGSVIEANTDDNTLLIISSGDGNNRWIGVNSGEGSGTSTDFYVAPTNAVPISQDYAWGTLQIVSNQALVTGIQKDDPGFLPVPAKDYSIKFPAVFPTGNAPDEDIPRGACVAAIVAAENSEGRSVKESNCFMPADVNPDGAAGPITDSTPTTLTTATNSNFGEFSPGDNLVMVDENDEISSYTIVSDEIVSVITESDWNQDQTWSTAIGAGGSWDYTAFTAVFDGNEATGGNTTGSADPPNRTLTGFASYFPNGSGPYTVEFLGPPASLTCQVNGNAAVSPDGPDVWTEAGVVDQIDTITLNMTSGAAIQFNGLRVNGKYLVDSTVPNAPQTAVLTLDSDQDLKFFRPGDEVQAQEFTGVKKLVCRFPGYSSNFYCEGVYLDGKLLWDSAQFPTPPIDNSTGQLITDYIEVTGATSNGTGYASYWANGIIGDQPNGKVSDTPWRPFSDKAVMNWNEPLNFSQVTVRTAQGSSGSVDGYIELEDGVTVVAYISMPEQKSVFDVVVGVNAGSVQVQSVDIPNSQIVVDGGDWNVGEQVTFGPVTGTGTFQVADSLNNTMTIQDSNDRWIDNTNRLSKNFYVRDNITVLNADNAKHVAMQQAIADAFDAFPEKVNERRTAIASSFYRLMDGETLSTADYSVLEETVLTAVNASEPFALDGYYPLYYTSAKADAASSAGSHHSHTINGVTYYMPDGGTLYHGNYIS